MDNREEESINAKKKNPLVEEHSVENQIWSQSLSRSNRSTNQRLIWGEREYDGARKRPSSGLKARDGEQRQPENPSVIQGAILFRPNSGSFTIYS